MTNMLPALNAYFNVLSICDRCIVRVIPTAVIYSPAIYTEHSKVPKREKENILLVDFTFPIHNLILINLYNFQNVSFMPRMTNCDEDAD